MKLTLLDITKLEKVQLTDRELLFIRLRTQMTLAEIGSLAGLSKQRVGKILEEAEIKASKQHVK